MVLVTSSRSQIDVDTQMRSTTAASDVENPFDGFVVTHVCDRRVDDAKMVARSNLNIIVLHVFPVGILPQLPQARGEMSGQQQQERMHVTKRQ